MTAERIAQEALALVDDDPLSAQARAWEALRVAGDSSDGAAASLAERALGLVALELGRVPEAVDVLRRAVSSAERARRLDRAAEARRSLMRALVEAGDARGALEQADLAAPGLRGESRAALQLMRALVEERLGNLAQAEEGYRKGLRFFRTQGDDLMVARALGNRGMLRVIRGQLAAARRDLTTAEQLMESLGQVSGAAKVRHSLAIVAARQGRVPEALGLLQDVSAAFERLEMKLDGAMTERDRCSMLLSVRLTRESVVAGRNAVRELDRLGAVADATEARLLLSDCLLEAGSAGEAAEIATEALAGFSAQGRDGWAAIARLSVVRSRFRAGARDTRLLRAACGAREDLERVGLRVQMIEASLIAGRTALSLGRRDLAREELGRAALHRGRGAAEVRRDAWLAEGFLRLSQADTSGCMSALRSGLRVVEEHRLLLGGSEPRATSAALGSELAGLGLRLALERGRPAEIFRWAEAWRGRGLAFPTVTPPERHGLARALEELRTVIAREEEAAQEGRLIPGLSQERLALERRIRNEAMRVAGHSSVGTPLPSLHVVREHLRDRVLIELVRSDDHLSAIVIAAGRSQLCDLGPAEEIDSELGSLAFALRRLALPDWPQPLRDSARARAEVAIARLGARLLDPVRSIVGDRALVLVPTGSLHGVPWGVLPGMVGRPISVAPSAALWLRAESSETPRQGRPVIAAGPGLPAAADEVRRVAKLHPSALTLTGAATTCGALLGALDGAPLAHVAAHGQPRVDNPLFSSIRLADGPLVVHELEALRVAPTIFVLPACDAGAHEIGFGDEIRGLAAALLGLGSKTVITSIGLAPDEATGELMVGLHEHLRDGVRPADALARAIAEVRVDDPGTALATKAAFACLGSG